MNKKKFLELIDRHKELFKYIILQDRTERRGFKHCAIVIVWSDKIGSFTTVKTMRGTVNDDKCNEVLEKYKKWLNKNLIQ